MITKNELIKFFELKNLKYDEVKIGVWQDYLKMFDASSVSDALNKVALDTAIFNPNVGHIVEKINEGNNSSSKQIAEREWQECLISARGGGDKPISARAAKALNSLGGMMWLRSSDTDKNEWHRKEFMNIYEITPTPMDADFRCLGLQAGMYIDDSRLLLD